MSSSGTCGGMDKRLEVMTSKYICSRQVDIPPPSKQVQNHFTQAPVHPHCSCPACVKWLGELSQGLSKDFSKLLASPNTPIPESPSQLLPTGRHKVGAF